MKRVSEERKSRGSSTMQVESNNTNGLHNRARLFARIPASIDLRSVSNCQAESEKHWKTSNNNNNNNQSGNNFTKPLHVKTSNLENTLVKLGSDGLPLDPRDWTRQHVRLWIVNLGRSEGINDVDNISDKFKMNGKALCLMSVEMFLSRFPTGGKMLYRDFRLRLTRALSL
ncbi:hypothetical protein PVAND_007205 [Polypedilum vanderplanki]|uniref:PNT domain-containing protein n=1 Tax=Polypedilum vanderplanki TaxID=319348 RepID=A0A9J6C640_POLVA|nr:hypothetical protein PVAND_007205 [Polypedilum vanderplanki]